MQISKTVYRRFILGKQGLWPGRRWVGKTGLASALHAVEAVQMDPVSIIAPSHDLVLWGRVDGYGYADLHALMYEERQFFDYGGALMIYPMEELPYWRTMMERYKLEKRWADFAAANAALLDDLRQALRKRGPLRKRDLRGRAVKNYRGSTDAGVGLYYLWLTGELMSYSRQGKERVYGFLEDIAPVDLQWQASEEDAVRFFIRKGIFQRGLVTQRDLRRILRAATGQSVSVKENKQELDALLEAGILQSLTVEGQKSPSYVPASDAALLTQLCKDEIPNAWQPVSFTTYDEVVFLSPLEYVSARGRANEVFDFDYIWEICKPELKRQYGPYTMPILYGDQLAGRIDAKLDRQNEIFLVNGLWLEEGFVLDDDFGAALAAGLVCLMGFLGVEQAGIQDVEHPVWPGNVIRELRSRGIIIE